MLTVYWRTRRRAEMHSVSVPSPTTFGFKASMQASPTTCFTLLRKASVMPPLVLKVPHSFALT